jgi:hypothetical protein
MLEFIRRYRMSYLYPALRDMLLAEIQESGQIELEAYIDEGVYVLTRGEKVRLVLLNQGRVTVTDDNNSYALVGTTDQKELAHLMNTAINSLVDVIIKKNVKCEVDIEIIKGYAFPESLVPTLNKLKAKSKDTRPYKYKAKQ